MKLITDIKIVQEGDGHGKQLVTIKVLSRNVRVHRVPIYPMEDGLESVGDPVVEEITLGPF